MWEKVIFSDGNNVVTHANDDKKYWTKLDSTQWRLHHISRLINISIYIPSSLFFLGFISCLSNKVRSSSVPISCLSLLSSETYKDIVKLYVFKCKTLKSCLTSSIVSWFVLLVFGLGFSSSSPWFDLKWDFRLKQLFFLNLIFWMSSSLEWLVVSPSVCW